MHIEGNMRRVAILLCGQMRRFQDPAVLASLHSFFRLFDTVDIFISTWSDRGISYNHGQERRHGDEGDHITEAMLRATYPTLKAVAIHDLKTWETTLSGCWKSVYTEGFPWNGGHIRGTVVPQLFTLADANRLRKEYAEAHGIQHDIVIRCRPDTLFQPHSRSIYEATKPNTIYAINNKATGTYWPQRIYDIFFFGTAAAMDVVCDAYAHLDQLTAHPWQNGLHPRDCCRCLYVQARFQYGLAVVDMPVDLCTVVR